MEKTEFALEYEIENLENADNKGIPVIIVAAGSSSRMGGIDKQFANIMGIPVIARTLSAFEKSKFVSRIILVTKEESIAKMQLIAEKYLISKLSDIIVGGKDRHASVLCGMERLTKDERKVLIHDGARPFVSEKIIENCVLELETNDGVVCGIKVTDTVKMAEPNGEITATVDREKLYLAQTPQGVDVNIYKEFSKKYENEIFTDDVSVLEKGKAKVKVVEGEKKNIKITTFEDLRYAELILEA